MGRKPNNNEVSVCCYCQTPLPLSSSFIKVRHSLYSSTGYLPICKECFETLVYRYSKKYGDDIRKAIIRVCMLYNLYYNDKIFNSCNGEVGMYIRQLNMVQYSKKSFDDTISEGFSFYEENAESKDEKVEDEDTQEYSIKKVDIERWEVGFEPEDYALLNKHYKYLKNANPNCDSNQEIFIMDLCYTKMQQMKALRNGEVDSFNKLTESYRKSFQQAGLKTTRDDSVVEEESWGKWVSRISQYTPEEYYKNKQLYKDYDKIDEYYQRHAGRPLDNIMNGTDVRDKEFYIHEGDEDENK